MKRYIAGVQIPYIKLAHCSFEQQLGDLEAVVGAY
jgi:hypothetical protein